MQLTFDSDEPIEKVLAVVSAVYGIEVVQRKQPGQGEPEGDQGITRPRPT